MNIIGKIPVLKRLYPSMMKRWAAVTWRGGHNIRPYNGLLWLLNWQNFVDRQIGLLGGFENAQWQYMLNAMREGGDAFLDVGANFGLYALQVAKEGNVKQIHAFEPDPRNIAQLSANLYLNRMTDAVVLHPVAVSDAEQYLSFNLCPDTSTGTTRVVEDGKGNASLKAIPLDSLFGEWQGKKIYIKIDIEGYEFAALSGARQLLKNNDCWLQIELFPENSERVIVYLRDLGYGCKHSIDCDYYFTRLA